MCFKRKQKVEGIHRITSFLDATSQLDWESGKEMAWSSLFEQCTDLIRHEIQYYYNSRQRSRVLSAIFRSAALIFGTLGFIAPLAEAAGHDGVGVYGYLLLVVSVAFFTANSLFGGTAGHTRYVVTQLQLEKLLALMVLEWQQYRSADQDTVPGQKRIEFLREKMGEAYKMILEETDAWGEALAEAVQEYERKVRDTSSAS